MNYYLTPHDIANNVRMTRTLFSGTIMIVEGDTDFRVYKRFVVTSQCELIPGHGKSNVIRAMKLLEKDNFKGLLAIIDSDFWNLEGTQAISKNIFQTDSHDLETMILSSSAFERALDEFGSDSKIKKFGIPIMDKLLECATPIGCLRWISCKTQDNLCLRFKGLSFENFINENSLVIDINALITEVKQNSNNQTLDERTIENKINILLQKGHDSWQICSGKDIIKILVIGLKNIFGKVKSKALTPELLDGALRLSYEYSEFCSTILYSVTKNWGNENPPFKVFM